MLSACMAGGKHDRQCRSGAECVESRDASPPALRRLHRCGVLFSRVVRRERAVGLAQGDAAGSVPEEFLDFRPTRHRLEEPQSPQVHGPPGYAALHFLKRSGDCFVRIRGSQPRVSRRARRIPDEAAGSRGRTPDGTGGGGLGKRKPKVALPSEVSVLWWKRRQVQVPRWPPATTRAILRGVGSSGEAQ